MQNENNNIQNESNVFLDKIVKKIWKTSHPNSINIKEEEYTKTVEFKTIEIEVKDFFKQLNDKYIECWNFLHHLINRINTSLIKDYFSYSSSRLIEDDEKYLIGIKTELFNEVENRINLSKDELIKLMTNAYSKINIEYEKLKKIFNEFTQFERDNNKTTIIKINEENKKKQKNKKILITLLSIFTIISTAFLLVVIFLFIPKK